MNVFKKIADSEKIMFLTLSGVGVKFLDKLINTEESKKFLSGVYIPYNGFMLHSLMGYYTDKTVSEETAIETAVVSFEKMKTTTKSDRCIGMSVIGAKKFGNEDNEVFAVIQTSNCLYVQRYLLKGGQEEQEQKLSSLLELFMEEVFLLKGHVIFNPLTESVKYDNFYTVSDSIRKVYCGVKPHSLTPKENLLIVPILEDSQIENVKTYEQYAKKLKKNLVFEISIFKQSGLRSNYKHLSTLTSKLKGGDYFTTSSLNFHDRFFEIKDQNFDYLMDAKTFNSSIRSKEHGGFRSWMNFIKELKESGKKVNIFDTDNFTVEDSITKIDFEVMKPLVQEVVNNITDIENV